MYYVIFKSIAQTQLFSLTNSVLILFSDSTTCLGLKSVGIQLNLRALETHIVLAKQRLCPVSDWCTAKRVSNDTETCLIMKKSVTISDAFSPQ